MLFNSGFFLQSLTRLRDFLPQVLYSWFFSLVFHWVKRFFTWIPRLLNVLCLAKFASKKESNCNGVSCLNIKLITRLGLISSYMTHTGVITPIQIEQKIVFEQPIIIDLQVHCHQPRRFISSTALQFIDLVSL